MNIEYSILFLSADSVKLSVTKTIEINGVSRNLPAETATSSISDIDEVKAKIPNPQLASILAIWEADAAEKEEGAT